MAEAGEFTLRAYMNGKMDLSQAEAVADLIASEHKAAHDIAMQQMRGGFSDELKALRTQLIDFTALIELELDFSEEDVEFANREQLNELIHNLKRKIQSLADSFSYGQAIKEGVPVAIAGKPNAGKSTLLNALFNEEKAIVSDIAGTTRDAIEDVLTLEGIKFRFIDTAGLRDTTDEIEAIGVARAKEKVQNARILLYLFNREEDTIEEIVAQIKALHHENLTLFLVENKIDRSGGFHASPFINQLQEALFGAYTQTIIGISSLEKTGLDALKNLLVQEVEAMKLTGTTVVSNSRHKAALDAANNSLIQVAQGLQMNLSGDLLAQDLREALAHIGSITGEIDVDEDILGSIFGKFCIGK
ncbi:unnamed protein product [Cyprideis torosa]|uniref:Uncharacterized protein n=1 Tax=Cyprideis torosa TaxID=163714 RepID=A0A7R8WNY4_9CRUS|nr:unnamed protein product [Cyprideis torosa]CAG0900144.1 unnamed protein product [Cyprideis torosa]